MVIVCKNEKIIGVVDYTNNLDVWDGSNWQNGGTGKHLGISVMQNKKERIYVLIHGSDFVGSQDYAEIIDKERAFYLIMKYNPDLLNEERFKELNKEKDKIFKEIK